MRKKKRPFVIEEALTRIGQTVAPFPKAAMFELADLGYISLFEQLLACIISIRTYDEVSLPCARALFALARTPDEVVRLTPNQIDTAIAQSTFHEAKSYQILAIAQQILQAYGGELPCSAEVLLSFKGVEPQCAHLAFGIACGVPSISVDIYVHRVTNRWGYVQGRTPRRRYCNSKRSCLNPIGSRLTSCWYPLANISAREHGPTVLLVLSSRCVNRLASSLLAST
jgi:endonuclease III